MISAIAAAAGFSSAAPCGNGSLASYIALGSGGCTIGSNTQFGFQTVSGTAGATPIATSALAIAPFAGSTSFGFTAALTQTAGANALFETIFNYRSTDGFGFVRSRGFTEHHGRFHAGWRLRRLGVGRQFYGSVH
jgi:hypothetical protein